MSQVKDITGKVYGILEVVKRAPNNSRGLARWYCKCNCGKLVIVNGSDLRSGRTKSCGDKIHKEGMNLKDLTGNRYGRLVVIKRGNNAQNGSVKWICQCDCGKTIEVYRSALQSGLTKSCGCLCTEINSKIHKHHGYRKTRIYSIWSNIIDRCENPNNSHYSYYGGRGIRMCDEWRKKPLSFIEWAYANGYDESAHYGECTIDRIDNDKGYSPDNCQWVSNLKQANNKRNNIYVTYNGETHSIAEWGRITGLGNKLYRRYRIYGWSFEKAIKDAVE